MPQFNLKSMLILLTLACCLLAFWLRYPFATYVCFVAGSATSACLVLTLKGCSSFQRWSGAVAFGTLSFVVCILIEYFRPNPDGTYLGLSRALPAACLLGVLLGTVVFFVVQGLLKLSQTFRNLIQPIHPGR